ncbi:MAG: sigma-70 family RNA polymerase sigma factor [Bacteroidales bacterium]|jgi:RNA polymerase sigma-70 factor (ECF subfamily)|nr:sigma-70 family RNA polymerase sigma factor [Bacteroidales bacterium]
MLQDGADKKELELIMKSKRFLHCTDDQLVHDYLNGNELALKELIERYHQKVFSYILMVVHNKELAEDLFQDTFIKVIHTIKAGSYREEGKFTQWIMRIARNLIIDYFRKNQKMAFVENSSPLDIFDTFSEPTLTVEQSIIMKQIYESLQGLIDLLPKRQKEVLYMRLYQEMSFKDIAEQTNVSINTALGRMRYAILNLRKFAKERNTVLTS